MGGTISDVRDGRVTVVFTGPLSEQQLLALQQATAKIIAERGKVRILALAQDFQGWERSGNWNDFELQERNDSSIEKMAIVGDKRWEDLTMMFTGGGMRPFPIEYFESSKLAQAEAWLDAE